MPPKNNSKNTNKPEVDVSIAPIFFIKDADLKPFVELFSHGPSNIVQQPLGNLFGFFKIRDTVEDSAYVVNFLSSVVKKEYYLNPRRAIEDSFDTALHKANFALSELAKNGNIEWMGSLDSAVCVIADSHFYFTVTGEAKILLMRDGLLTDISEGLTEEEAEPYPLKTFVNVSSGTLKSKDKLIITSENIYRVFSATEIKKNALRFPRNKFVQFMHTALINELDTAETIIVDVFEVEKNEKRKAKDKTKEEPGLANAFSAEAYAKPERKKSEVFFEEKNKSEFIDEKTGHIYVQGESKNTDHENQLSIRWSSFKENLSDFLFWLKDFLKRSSRSAFLFLRESWHKSRAIKIREIIPKGVRGSEESKSHAAGLPASLENLRKYAIRFKKFMPSPSRIRSIYFRLDKQQRMYGVMVIAAIIILPWLVMKLKSLEQAPVSQTEDVAPQPGLMEILANDKNIKLDAQATPVFAEEKVFLAGIMGDSKVVVSENKAVLIGNNNEVKTAIFPDSTAAIKDLAAMDDLSLIFLLTNDQKLVSFSPSSSQFGSQNISFPENSDISAIATYLTYLYAADSSSNSIYRYPRAEGGFGPGASWLKEEIDLRNVNDMAIDENIFLIKDNEVLKLFKGRRESFNFENSATPIKFSKIFTGTEVSNIYILDSQNARVVVFSKGGELLRQYFNETILNAKDFTVDEKNNKVYLVTNDEKLVQIDL